MGDVIELPQKLNFKDISNDGCTLVSLTRMVLKVYIPGSKYEFTSMTKVWKNWLLQKLKTIEHTLTTTAKVTKNNVSSIEVERYGFAHLCPIMMPIIFLAYIFGLILTHVTQR